MMAEIIELDASLSNKIAAGEVVERPASVVKELVENSIDAGSTIINIEIVEAGLEKIRVIDNGKGIAEEDILTAFKRHATSKIKNENDLFRIRTLGFRGEALPSIASVSHIEMVSAKEGQPGTKIVLEGGILQLQERTTGRKGTDITVSNLFYNTPARLKYLKTLHTEIGHISDIVNRMALAHPYIAFHLRHNDKTLLSTNGNGNLRQVMAAIYGIQIARKMIPFHAESLDFKISGLLSLPEVTRASKNYISTMINGRFIKNYSLVNAILEGYYTLLPINRFPIVLLKVEMDPILVDVNVHPAKLTVRLSKEEELNKLITETIKDLFRKQTLIPSPMSIEKRKQPAINEQTTLSLEPKIHKKKTEITYNPPLYEERETVKEIQHNSELNNAVSHQTIAENKEQSYETNEAKENVQEEKIRTERVKKDRIPPLYPIGQLHGTYIVAQNELGLYLIDQHAAQERIKYEYFREKVGQVERELQELLVPITLQFSTDEYMKIQEHKDTLAKTGIFLEEFGGNSYIIRSHPQWFPKGYEKETIEEIIQQLLEMKKIDIQKLFEDVAIMMSCKGSIKANRFLRNDEIQALLDELRLTEDPFTCPHGRPIIVHFSTYEIEKMFKRVM